MSGLSRGVSPTLAAAGVALWLVTVDNVGFWRTFTGAQSLSFASIGATVALAAVLWLGLTTLLRMAGPRWLVKPLWAALLVTSAAAAHFVDGWGVLLDKAMIRNVLQTDLREVAEFVTRPLVLDVLLRGVLAAVTVALLPLRTPSLRASTGAVLLLAVATALALAAALAAFYPIYASTFRNHRELRLQLVPSNYLVALYSVLRPRRAAAFVAIATDATRAAERGRALLVVLVVGETARADNFSLGGYARPTNQALSGKPVVYFSNVMSCGTDTATSLPCMFSDLGALDFSPEAASRRENVLDVLQRTGVQVHWIENSSGCKGVCDRVPMTVAQDPQHCSGADGCFDEALVQALGHRLPPGDGDGLVVMHQQGSHGPAYFKRYPAPGRFGPTCDTSRLQDCDAQTLVNTYDNTIDYTSRVLAQTIDELARRAPERDVLLLYLSDHGESLGERGLYLHGMPRWLAPHEQLHVPMLMWMNEAGRERLVQRSDCLRATAAQALSHDNLFHTLLGVFDVRTNAYRPELDVLAPARGRMPCPDAPGTTMHR